jgi:Rad3-related DNA helicase
LRHWKRGKIESENKRRWSKPSSNLIQARGGDAFTEYSLPEAILKLRPGVGRLIRTTTDRGIIMILDNRIVTRPYGRAFMQALLKCVVSYTTSRH